MRKVFFIAVFITPCFFSSAALSAAEKTDIGASNLINAKSKTTNDKENRVNIDESDSKAIQKKSHYVSPVSEISNPPSKVLATDQKNVEANEKMEVITNQKGTKFYCNPNGKKTTIKMQTNNELTPPPLHSNYK